ncbi:SHOCT domain-containing protein [Clostridium algoriphilum]|nr:SHOCT domain-containing protein [Clostridium algoriphilum]MCB2295406.1 SHOCT domain-containing protein [Clostridium algoriphilum]
MELEGNQQRVTDEIMKYKELLDDGIITEEDFSIKEKELLK